MKATRQAKILELIQNGVVETQKDIVDALCTLNYDVTQATVSRDIRELKLTKVATSNGTQKYAVLQPTAESKSEKMYQIIVDGVVSVNYAQNIVVIKTLTGLANGVGAAIDSIYSQEILGCIAGDDTLICILRNEQQAINFIKKIK